jgi:hypothetical protein
VMARWDNEQAGAETKRLPHWHRRTDAHPPGRVRTRSNDAAFFGFSSYSERFSAQTRIMGLFDGTVEGIQVDMKDCTGHINPIIRKKESLKDIEQSLKKRYTRGV